ncbi:class III lanthipeptide, partial [Paenibacillus thiaminolyticus]
MNAVLELQKLAHDT